MSAENIRKVKVIVLGDSGELHVTKKLHLNTPNFSLSDYVTFFSSLSPLLLCHLLHHCLSLSSAGVGKTSLVHLICHGEVLTNPSSTVGCNVEVKVLVW